MISFMIMLWLMFSEEHFQLSTGGMVGLLSVDMTILWGITLLCLM